MLTTESLPTAYETGVNTVMRFMAIITVNNPSMSSVDWIEHHTKMKNIICH